KKEILIKRNEITQRIFDNIEKKLKAYTVTSEYRQKLNNQIKCFLEKNGNDYNIFVRKEDAEFLTDIKFTVSNKIHLGGFIASNENLYFDNTLENRLDLQKEYYIKNSSFELED
ncbi:MAG: V-type ATP synthase subunit E family protein, partial [Oscillospiraceae bacterium]